MFPVRCRRFVADRASSCELRFCFRACCVAWWEGARMTALFLGLTPLLGGLPFGISAFLRGCLIKGLLCFFEHVADRFLRPVQHVVYPAECTWELSLLVLEVQAIDADVQSTCNAESSTLRAIRTRLLSN